MLSLPGQKSALKEKEIVFAIIFKQVSFKAQSGLKRKPLKFCQ